MSAKETTASSIEDAPALPLPAMHSLEELVSALDVHGMMLSPAQRAARAKCVVDHDGEFVKELVRVADQCKDMDDDESLEMLFQIVKLLLELCDAPILHLLLSDAYFLDIIGILEHNPNVLTKLPFRADLEGRMKFQQVIPIEDEAVLAAIHMNFRMDAIKDNVLSRTLADGCAMWLECLMNENNICILTYISNRPDYIGQLWALVADAATQPLAIRLLQHLMRLIQITQPPARNPGLAHRLPQMFKADTTGVNPVFGSLHHALFATAPNGQGLLSSFAKVLGVPAAASLETRTVVLELVHSLVIFQGGDIVRSYMADERNARDVGLSAATCFLAWEAGDSLLFGLLLALYHHEAHRGQVLDILKLLFNVIPGKDDKFLGMVYTGYIPWLFHLLTLPDDAGGLYGRHATVVEVLTLCIANHGYRVKYVFARQPVAQLLSAMLASSDKFAQIKAAKCLKACVAMNEAFYSKFVLSGSLLADLFGLLRAAGKTKAGRVHCTAVVSAALDVLGTAETKHCVSILEHVHATYATEFAPLFPGLFAAIQRQVETDDADGSCTEEMALASVASTAGGRVMLNDEDEAYWEKDDDMVGPMPLDKATDELGSPDKTEDAPPPLVPLAEREDPGFVVAASPSRKVKPMAMFAKLPWKRKSSADETDAPSFDFKKQKAELLG
ncbi:serine/threonine-protein phosphatase 4 regulatory subunit [Achlya hypogyna]|uniref:Serine/threonine-protein phosphatase 4 regulatory subunit n=1 Tax=Achlya hypogyna TaxID=1202772 RepID=A0A1V9Z576_ACHHY|nr:serine/threonine-protein phosphatase 4 regulatory subunit [Achlya hypogyna]